MCAGLCTSCERCAQTPHPGEGSLALARPQGLPVCSGQLPPSLISRLGAPHPTCLPCYTIPISLKAILINLDMY